MSDHTGFPEILDGRVKTLHPLIHGGLLARRDDPVPRGGNKESRHCADRPFGRQSLPVLKATVAKGASFEDCIEDIDIGGPALLRAASKNHGLRHRRRGHNRL